MGRHVLLKFLMFAFAGLLVSACNLSNVPPTSTPAPTATFVAPLVDPATEPVQADPGTLAPGATQTPQVAANPNCAATPPGWVPYTIVAGDTLGLLATQTESTIDELVAGNCLANADQIEVDAVIFLPSQPVVAQ